MVIPENTYVSNIVQTEQVVLMYLELYLYIQSCMYIRETNTKKEAIDLKKGKKG